MVHASKAAPSVARLSDWAQGRSVFDARSAPVYLCIALLASAAGCMALLLGYRWDGGFTGGLSMALGLFIAMAFAARWIGFGNLAGATESCLLLLAISTLASIGAFVAAGLSLPLVDTRLAAIDSAAFGFEHATAVRLMHDWPGFHFACIQIYNTLSIQPFLLLPVLFLCRKDHAAWRFLLAWSLTLIACVAVSPFMPAHGGPPYALNWQDVFDGARDGTRRVIDGTVLTGIITFPSFHAAGAVLLGWGAWCIGPVRWPMLALNAAVIVTAVMVGGHYIIDLVAGGLVAGLAILAAAKVHRQ
ncbi:MAG: hypothetical protein RLZZ08_288 [Pseudomonadota bacterium]|jgi:membrane-associated phospholipid phosphatase